MKLQIPMKANLPHPTKSVRPTGTLGAKVARGKPLTESEIRQMFRAMHHPRAGTRRLVDARRLGC